jgi:hypothetical protein
MKDFRAVILDRAFRIVAGTSFNSVRRELLEGAGIVPIIYEVTMPPGESWEAFRDRVFPLLARYLKAHGVDPACPDVVIVAVFFEDRCHLIKGSRFLEALEEMEGLNSQALHFRILRWLAE